MFRSMPSLAGAPLALIAAGAFPAPASAQQSGTSGAGWFVEAGVGALSVPASDAANVTMRGTTPLATLRVGRGVAPRVHLTLSAAYGEVAEARRDVYERPAGPTRTETYDYHALLALAGAEFARPASRAEIFGKVEAGWVRTGWRLANWSDPAGLPAPRSSAGGGVVVSAGLGLRYWFADRVSMSGAARIATGAGALDGRADLLPELALRWRF